MIQKDLSSNSITPLYISRRRSLTDTISLLSKPSTRVFQGEYDKVWNSHMFFAGISELWDLGWSCVDQEHGFKVTEPIQHGAVTKMSVLMSAFVSRSFLWPGETWEAGIVTILKHPFGFGKQICLIWNQFGDEMDLGRRRKTFPNLSWNGSDARESGAWWSILFFFVISILRQFWTFWTGGEVRGKRTQWRLADKGRWLTVYLQNFDRMFLMTA